MTYSATITPDLTAASLGVCTCYLFQKWLSKPTTVGAVFCGIMLGACELTKYTWLILYPLFALLVLFNLFNSKNSVAQVLVNVALIFGISVYVINLGFGFENTFQPLGDFEFFSYQLSQQEFGSGISGNIFRETWLGKFPVPLPEQMLMGIDFVKGEFERGYPSYLRGEHRHGGWWYYYLYAMLVKMPLGTQLMFFCSCALVVLRNTSSSARDHIALLAPAFAVVLMVSSQTGFNHHLRYVLPAFPFIFIFASQAMTLTSHRLLTCRLAPLMLVLQSTVSMLLVYPFTMSYFNEAAGGPLSGWRHLDYSNIDWGQDIGRLPEWCDRNKEKQPLFLSTKSSLPYSSLGVTAGDAIPEEFEGVRQFPAGWYALGVHQMLRPDSDLAVFFELVPKDNIGYSMYIYHLAEPLVVEP